MGIISERKHPIILARENKQRLNALAYAGGQDYVNARLWRAPNESQLSWSGKATRNYGEWATGRRDRAVCHREGGRVADKINQYLFSKPVERSGVDNKFSANAGIGGESLSEIWQEISKQVTLNGWCWVAIHVPITPEGMSLNAARAAGLGVRLAVLKPWEVPDWHFRSDGSLGWAITEAEVLDNEDPEREAAQVALRTLWRQTERVLQVATYKDGKLVRDTTFSRQPIPLVLVGRISDQPWWFDEVESEQAKLMNLQSLHDENLMRAVFPQLVISSSTFDNLEMRLVERQGGISAASVIEVVKEMTRSADAPIVESSEDKGITRYICPSATDLEAIPKSIKSARFDLFESVGLALFNREQRTVQTAESKAFDHLDTAATLGQRAELLQAAERSVVAMIKLLDPNFQTYEPVWNKDFDVPDVSGDAHALVQVGSIPGLTLTQRKTLLRAATHVLSGICAVSQEEKAEIEAEIDALTDDVGEPIV